MSRQLFATPPDLSDVDLRIRRLEERVARLEAMLRALPAAAAKEPRASG